MAEIKKQMNMDRKKATGRRKVTTIALVLCSLLFCYAGDVVIGDVNGDGKVDSADISSLVSHIIGQTPEDFVGEAADVNDDKAVDMADVAAIIDQATAGEKNLVTVVYEDGAATVTVARNVAQYVTPTVNGAHVSISQTNTADVDSDEITYLLSGTSSDGEFSLAGEYKCTIALNGLTLTNPDGAAISSTNKKRLQVSVKKDTENTLTDGAGGSQKGCLYSKGQIQLQGNGVLNVYGNTAHAIKSADYITVKNLTLNVKSAVKDGINCAEYFLMKSGTVTISGVGDDGIQADVDGDTPTGETTDHEDEDSGNVYIEGGTLTVTSTAAASKGVKAEGDVKVTDGIVNVATTGGGTWDEDDADTKAACGMSADGFMTISGGTLTLSSSGAGGKCLKCDSVLTISDSAVIAATATGQKYTYNYNGTTYSSSPKAIKAGVKTEKQQEQGSSTSREYAPPGGGGGGFGPGGFGPGGGGGFGPGGQDNNEYDYYGGIVIAGGNVYAKSANHEAIESKCTIDISGGYIYAEAGDDAINSAGNFTVTGGYLMGNSTGNDGLDANGDFYIKGGCVFAVASRSPEVGIDANTEGGKKLYISGGNVVAIGGLESGSSLTGVTQKSTSYSQGSWYTLKNGSSTAFSFKVPSNGNNMGSGMTLVTPSTPSVTSGQTGTTTIWEGYGSINSF